MNLGTASYTGINHWWTYEEDAIPGIGKYMVNVGLGGNLLIQADDMAIPHKGIALAFRRTYNSLSQHDYAGTDGSGTSNYGAGWTNTFDAHIAFNSGQGGTGISVYDIDGARYDYASDGAGHWIPPPGQYATLVYDGGNGYQWTKKSGTVYYFWYPFGAPLAGIAGRLYQIWGRNHNTTLTFSMAFQNGDPSCACNLTVITVSEEDGRYAQLLFSDFTVNGQPERLLSTLVWPGGTTVAYSYDASGNLAEVDEPANNTYSTSCHGGLTHCLPQMYYYYSGSSHMSYAFGPRVVMTAIQGIPDWSSSLAGNYLNFGYDSNNALSGVCYVGFMNPTPNDGTNSPIQPGIYNGTVYRNVGFSRSASSDTWADSDGHESVYTFDSLGRSTQKSDWTGSLFLTTSLGWDTQNNLISSTDARGSETDYAYDNNGNTIAVALPAVPNSEGGTFRPTSLYSYDVVSGVTNNNIIAYCDPHLNHPSRDWTSRPAASDSLCPSSAGATLMTWSYPNYQLSGELQAITSPVGYSRSFGYNSGAQGGSLDYGLPTSDTGQSIGPQADGTSRTPTQLFTYDAYGDLLSYCAGLASCLGGGGAGTPGMTTYTYDALSRMTNATDGDNVSNSRTFNADGTVATTQSPSQLAAGVSAGFSYDADRNVYSETHYHGCVQGYACAPGTTLKWYDGSDRLVEVKQPQDSSDLYGYAWMTRYLYDLSAGGSVSIGADSGRRAYGNLYITQEYLNSLTYNYGAYYNAPAPSWFPSKGTTYDALDRSVAKYDQTMYSHPQTISTYDQYGYSGQLTSQLNALNQAETLAYDLANRLTQVTFSDGTPSRTTSYDADGRVSSVLSSTFGLLSYTYDAQGKVTTESEPSAGGLTNPAQLTYAYYADGTKRGVAVSASSFCGSNCFLYTYSYRQDGLLQNQGINWTGASPLTFTYTPGGRATLVAGIETLNYDTFGRIQSGPSSSGPIAYDYEGTAVHEPNYNAAAGGYGVDATHAVTSRGEIWANIYGLNSAVYQFQSLTSTPTLWPLSLQQFANGYGTNGQNCNSRHTQCNFNHYNPGDFFAADSAPIDGSPPGGHINGTTYDVMGRNTQQFQTESNGLGSYCYGNFSRTYDFENHLIASPYTDWVFQSVSGQCGGPSGNTAYGWGPNGHPVSMTATLSSSPALGGAAYGPITLHWDGDSLLYITDQTGQVLDIKAGGYGDVLPSGGTWLYIRNLAGHVIAGVASDGSNLGSSVDDPYQQYGGQFYSNGNYPDYVSQYGVVTEPASDGIWDGLNVIQGTRAYDPESGVWTTPDAYAGVAQDPISQKPYIWNRNNSLLFADPSGFDTIELEWHYVSWTGGIAGHGLFRITDDKGNTKVTEFGPEHDFSLSPGKLVQKNYNPGTLISAHKWTCKGTCTASNGGINEAGVKNILEYYIEAGLGYRASAGPNSNAPIYKACVEGGGGAAACAPPGGVTFGKLPPFSNSMHYGSNVMLVDLSDDLGGGICQICTTAPAPPPHSK